MSAQFCLLPTEVDRFKQALTSGEINPENLSNMTSEERHALFSKLTGETNAKGVNSLFESKLLLKNKQQGMVTWAKKISGMTPDAKRTLEAKIARMDRILNPEEEKAFLKDLASTRLGVDVSVDEAKQIADLSAKVQDSSAKAEDAVKTQGYTKTNKDLRLQAGVDKVALQNHIENLKKIGNKPTIGQTLNPSRYIKETKSLMGMAKGLVASLTSHAPLKHGFFALFEDPKHWAANYAKQFGDVARTIGGKDVMSAVKAEGYSRENSINGLYDKWIPGELSKINEEFHSDLPEKIPVLGSRLYKGSKVMFDAFNLRMRMDLVDHYINIVEKMGLNPRDPEVAKAWGKLAIDQSGGKTTNPDSVLGNFLFSQRLIKSQTNNLTMHLFDKTATKAVKIQAAKTLAKVAVGIGGVMVTANALRPGTIEFDPRSSNFGKLKIGDTRFDIAGGYGSIIALASRIAAAVDGKASIKSSSSGVMTKLGSGFGQTSYQTLIGDFFQGRASPAGQIVADLANHQNFAGNKPSVKSEAGTAVTPIPIQTYSQLKNDKQSANILAVMIAQQLGLMSNTFGSSKKDWNVNPTSAQSQFLQKVGQKTFNQANQVYNREIDAWDQANLSKLQGQSNANKQKFITKAHADIQKAVFNKYGFKPAKAGKTSKSLLDQFKYTGKP